MMEDVEDCLIVIGAQQVCLTLVFTTHEVMADHHLVSDTFLKTYDYTPTCPFNPNHRI